MSQADTAVHLLVSFWSLHVYPPTAGQPHSIIWDILKTCLMYCFLFPTSHIFWGLLPCFLSTHPEKNAIIHSSSVYLINIYPETCSVLGVEAISEQSRGPLASLRTSYSCECACVRACMCVCVCVCVYVCRVTRSITGCSVSFEFQINNNTF